VSRPLGSHYRWSIKEGGPPTSLPSAAAHWGPPLPWSAACPGWPPPAAVPASPPPCPCVHSRPGGSLARLERIISPRGAWFRLQTAGVSPSPPPPSPHCHLPSLPPFPQPRSRKRRRGGNGRRGHTLVAHVGSAGPATAALQVRGRGGSFCIAGALTWFADPALRTPAAHPSPRTPHPPAALCALRALGALLLRALGALL